MDETNKQWYACICISIRDVDGETHVNYLVKVHI